MPRRSHGDIVSLDDINAAIANFNSLHAGGPDDAPELPPLGSFRHLFPELQGDSANLLREEPATVASLVKLGIAMQESAPFEDTTLDSAIPSLYTYFGQFIDHDITFETVTRDIDLTDENLSPLSLDVIDKSLKNLRFPTLDLDSIYSDKHLPLPGINPLTVEVPREPEDSAFLKIGKVKDNDTPRPAGKSDYNDVPREGRSTDPKHDRAGIIGDPRNDENVIICQLHVAFLHAHNAIVKSVETFEEARKLLRQHYQNIVIQDYLRRVANPQIVDEMLNHPEQNYNPPDNDLFMPLEFSVAAFRFGHSMIRTAYDFNINADFNAKARLYQLFRVLGRYDTLPQSWIIEWERFVEGGTNVARQIDTQLVEPLFMLQRLSSSELGKEMRLAVRNLLRGYLLRLPTGQAMAKRLEVTPLTPDQLLSVTTPAQKTVLSNSGFAERTPLWFYILAEAAFERRKEETPVDYLGPVGSKLLASVLIGLIRKSPDSILKPGADLPPDLCKTLPELLKLAGALT